MRSLVSTLVFSSVISQASININTLPPDLRNLDFLERIPPRSTIDPAWAGHHRAALDGDQNKVSVSWTLEGDSIEFQVSNPSFLHCATFQQFPFGQSDICPRWIYWAVCGGCPLMEITQTLRDPKRHFNVALSPCWQMVILASRRYLTRDYGHNK